MKRLRSTCLAVLIGVLMMLLCVVSGYLFIQMLKEQSLTAEYQHMAEELQIENSQLMQLLNSTPLSSSELSAEETKLKLLLKKTLLEKTQVEKEKKQLATLLQSTEEQRNQLETQVGALYKHIGSTQRLIDMASAESIHWREIFESEQQTNIQLKELINRQESILFTSKLSFLWGFCNRNTMQCSHCPIGWIEHASRCFFLSKESEDWEKARRQCLDMGADLAVVQNAEDQAFLTNMTFHLVQQHPGEEFRSAWIGLQDMAMEGHFFWVTGQRIHPHVTYWRSGEPDNGMASRDKSPDGQDCVTIVLPTSSEKQDWLNSWDDIICAGRRHFLCETTPLSLT